MTWLTVQRRTIRRPDNGSIDYYELDLVLSNDAPMGASLGEGGGDPGGFPYVLPPPTEFCCTDPGALGASDIRATEIYRGTFTGTGHNASVTIASFDITGNPPTGDWTSLNLVYSWNGGAQATAYVKSAKIANPSEFTQNMCWNAGAISSCTSTIGGTTPTGIVKPSGGSEVLRIFGISAYSPTGPTTFCLTIGDVVDIATGLVVSNELGDSGSGPPSPGQWVYGETASMAGAVGTLDFPYADGSLKVRVDGVLITPASYTETSPSAGTFTLDWQPDTDETVTVDYQGR